MNYTPIQLKLPVDMERIIEINDSVYTFNEVVSHIDLKKYFVEKDYKATGRPRCEREKLLKVLLFAFMEHGYPSLREIEKLCKVDIRFIWLLDEMKAPSYRKYFGKKLIWFLITLVCAVILNFILPRLMPSDPVSAITGKLAAGMSVVLLVIFAVNLKIAPIAGGYAHDMIPNFSWPFIKSVISHYQLPFWSIVIISIGGQAIGMRSMFIYELNADYVKYSRFLGIKDSKIVGYVFRNAMLTQITGLAMSIGTMMGGALVAEIIFSYPGLGSAMYKAVVAADYPLISACTLTITLISFSLNLMNTGLDQVFNPTLRD